MTDSGYDELMKYVSFEYVISINIAKLLKIFSWTLRDSYVACMISLDDISLPNTGTMFNPTKKAILKMELVEKKTQITIIMIQIVALLKLN